MLFLSLKFSSSKKPIFIATGYCHDGNSEQGIGGRRAPDVGSRIQAGTNAELPLPRPSSGLSLTPPPPFPPLGAAGQVFLMSFLIEQESIWANR